MIKLSTYRKRWRKYHGQYESFAYKILKKVFETWSKNIRFEDMTEDNYKSLIKEGIDRQLMVGAYNEIYTKIGIKHGERVGTTINAQLKNFSLGDFVNTYMRNITSWLLDNGSSRITMVEQTYFDDINRLIANALNEGININEVARDIDALIQENSFYRWKALRIARTETTTAANRAALEAGDVSGFVMNKVWISALDNRTRVIPEDSFDHLDMNGVQVERNEKFIVPGIEGNEALEYPGAPNGSAGNVINCRCTVAIVPARDRNGQLIPNN